MAPSTSTLALTRIRQQRERLIAVAGQNDLVEALDATGGVHLNPFSRRVGLNAPRNPASQSGASAREAPRCN